jgi:hypothetical protein
VEVFLVDHFAPRCLRGLRFFGPFGRMNWSHVSRNELDEREMVGLGECLASGLLVS